MLENLTAHEKAGLSWLYGKNEKAFKVFEAVIEKQKTSVQFHSEAFRILSGIPSMLPYESPLLPLCVDKAEGARIWDVDGNEYIDCHMAYTAHILGYNHPYVLQAFQKAAQRGIAAGHFFQEQIELGNLVLKFIPGLERVAFFHTGAEAIQAAVRLARAVTKKRKVGKFEGCYHGAHEIGLHNTWMALAGRLNQDPLDQIKPCFDTGGGISRSEDYLILPYNSPIALDLIRQNANELACIVVDPVPDFMTNWLEDCKQFMDSLCKVAEEKKIPLIFDEVVCGFRLARGGAREWLGYNPAMSCYGKVTSGLGIPLSILGGEAKFLDYARTSGQYIDYGTKKAWLASTMNSNFLSIVAALAQMRYLWEHYDEVTQRLDRNHEYLRTRLANFALKTGIPVSLEGNSRLKQHLSIAKQKPQEKTYRSLMGSANTLQFRTLMAMTFYLRLHGVYTKLIPTMHFSAAHTEEIMEQLAERLEKSLLQMQQDGMILY